MDRSRMPRTSLSIGLVIYALFGLTSTVVAEPDQPQTRVRLEGDPITVEFLTHTWPGRPRLRGYEFNQKNHQDTPEFVERGGPLLRSNPGVGKRYRVVGLRFENHTADPIALTYTSKRLEREPRRRLTIPGDGYATRFYAVRVDPETPYDLTVLHGDATLFDDVEVQLPAAHHTTRDPREAQSVARELTREDKVRRELATRAVTITIRDDFGQPVERARVLLLRDEGLMVYEGETDATGGFRADVLPGGYRSFAFRTIPPPEKKADDLSAVTPRPRLLALSGRIERDRTRADLAPTQTVEGSVRDVEGIGLSVRNLWITPTELAASFRYEAVARRVGSRARVTYTGNSDTTGFLFLTNGLEVEISARAEVDPATTVLMRQRVKGTPEVTELVFDPARHARAIFDPPAGPGDGLRGRVQVLASDGTRERFTVDTDDLHTFYLHPGGYRFETRYLTRRRSLVEFLPYRRELTVDRLYDLTPREPFTPTVHYERLDKKMQFWLAITDADGRVLRRPPGPVTRFARDARGIVSNPIENPRWELAAGAERVKLEDLFVAIELEFDGVKTRGKPQVEQFVRVSTPGATGQAPRPLAERLDALLPEVKLSIDGSRRFLDLPPGARNQHMNFDVLLPPGVGGLGGGDTITLDIAALFPFAAGTDIFPGAFRHELGHCLGFGHDPYMLLAPTGIDEERFGSFGYRMLHAASFQRGLSYLARNRHTMREPWAPNEGVFPVLRMLYGEDVHLGMFQQRKVAEKTLTLVGLSSIERIATLYSLALDRNVAWVFRAMGWPVTDEAVDRGGHAFRFAKKHPPQLDYANVKGTPLQAWWVYGPVRDAEDETSGWRRVEWPSRFVRVDEARDPVDHEQRYLFYRTVTSPKDIDARILCASDVQLEIRVNGTPVANLDASPQYSQPLHDELMLDQKRPYAATLFKGENTVEVAINQPPGSRGFLLEFIRPDGTALPLGLGEDGPPGEALTDERTRLTLGDAMLNGGFDLNGGSRTAWINGPIEGGLRFALETEAHVSAPASLRADARGPGRGGFIQRVVVEPGKRYRLAAALRSEGLRGKAYVSLFTQDVHGRLARTEQIEVADPRGRERPWRRVEATWAAGKRRVVYVACYVEATAGRVWFDDVSLQPID